ncbi:MAG: tetratricopeptide repeat protein [Nitrospirae bacterium]|nr:tetratricopeptide repeat protein [Nitrospirota bacterium]
MYFNSLQNGFHFDDTHHIIDNNHLKGLRYIPELFTDTRTFSVWEGNNRHYRPLLLLTYSINYAIGGVNPVGYHIVNLAFHVGSAFLLFLILKAMLTPTLSLPPQGGGKKGGGSIAAGLSLRSMPFFIALASTLIFAVHPFNSEVVNYISARSSVMSGFFYLLAFYSWVKFREVGNSGSSKQVAGKVAGSSEQVAGKSATRYPLPATYYIASLLAFLLGMLTKEVVITLPIVLWLYDFYFVHLPDSQGRARFVSHLKRLSVYMPFLLVALSYVIVREILVKRSGGVPVSAWPRGYYENLLMESKALVKYIYLWLIPSNLSIEHTVTQVFSLFDPYLLLSIGFITALLLLSIWLFLNRKNPVFAIASFFIIWYFIVLLPLMIIPLNTVLQENRGYMAVVFLSVGAGVLIGYSDRIFPRFHKWTGISILISVLIFYSAVTIGRNRTWKDDLTLWTDATMKSPLSARAHEYLGLTYREIGRIGSAIVEYQNAIRLGEGAHRASAHNNLGALYGDMRLWDLAIQEFRIAIEINPNYYKAYNNLGTVYMINGDLDEAARNYKKAIKIYPGYTSAGMNLARLYEKRDKLGSE